MTEPTTADRVRRPRRPSKTVALVAALVVGLVAAGALVVVLIRDEESSTTLVDDFSRPAGAAALAPVSGGPDWIAVRGKWRIGNRVAKVVSSEPPASLAIAAMPKSTGSTQVRIDQVEPGAGVVFRYQGPNAYWEVVAAPAYLTWQINKVQNGRTTVVATTGPYSPVDNATVVTVATDGAAITVKLDGKVRKQLFDAYLKDATGAGLVAAGQNATGARFAAFRFSSD